MTATKKILLVDDSPTVLLSHRMLLQSDRWVVVTARDGVEALEVAAAIRPDLILMDVVMPRMNGFEAVRRLRESEGTKTTPIIMVTTRAEEKVVEVCYRMGCNDYVNKPVDRARLLAKIDTLLGLPKVAA